MVNNDTYGGNLDTEPAWDSPGFIPDFEVDVDLSTLYSKIWNNCYKDNEFTTEVCGLFCQELKPDCEHSSTEEGFAPLSWVYENIPGDAYYQFLEDDDYTPVSGPTVSIGRLPVGSWPQKTCPNGVDVPAYEPSQQLVDYLDRLNAFEQEASAVPMSTLLAFGAYDKKKTTDWLKDIPLLNCSHGGVLQAESDSLAPLRSVAGFLNDQNELVPDADALSEEFLALWEEGAYLGFGMGHGSASSMPGITTTFDDPTGTAGTYHGVRAGAYLAWACNTGCLQMQEREPVIAQSLLFLPCDETREGGFMATRGTTDSVLGSAHQPVVRHPFHLATKRFPHTLGLLDTETKMFGMPVTTSQEFHYQWYQLNLFGMPTYSLDLLDDFDSDGNPNPRPDWIGLYESPSMVAAKKSADWQRPLDPAASGVETYNTGFDLCPWQPGDGTQADSDLGLAIDPAFKGVSDLAGDECDNCPEVRNLDQADSDTDGVGDACDASPGLHNDDAVDEHLEGFSLTFDTIHSVGLPNLPAGKYRIWADVEAEGGFLYLGTTVKLEAFQSGAGYASASIELDDSSIAETELILNGPGFFTIRVTISSLLMYSVDIKRLKVITEEYPYQFAYFDESPEEWESSQYAHIVPMQVPQPGNGIVEGWSIRGLAGYVATPSEAEAWADTTVYCPLNLEHLALQPGRSYMVEFTYKTLAHQPYTFAESQIGDVTELPPQLHIVRVIGDMDDGPEQIVQQFEFSASPGEAARIPFFIDGTTGAALQFCQRGYGRYVVDNVTLKEVASE